MKYRRRQWLLRRITLGLALATVGPASANPYP
jgi:hypothetical protein